MPVPLGSKWLLHLPRRALEEKLNELGAGKAVRVHGQGKGTEASSGTTDSEVLTLSSCQRGLVLQPDFSLRNCCCSLFLSRHH